MKVSSEAVTIEAGGALTLTTTATLTTGTGAVTIGTGGTFDGKLATAGFYPPQIANGSLPTASGVEGMVAYDTTNNKLVVSNGTAWETVTSA